MSSQQGERKKYDVLVIGSGLAGLYFCLRIAKENPKAKIALITKTSLKFHLLDFSIHIIFCITLSLSVGRPNNLFDWSITN